MSFLWEPLHGSKPGNSSYWCTKGNKRKQNNQFLHVSGPLADCFEMTPDMGRRNVGPTNQDPTNTLGRTDCHSDSLVGGDFKFPDFWMARFLDCRLSAGNSGDVFFKKLTFSRGKHGRYTTWPIPSHRMTK